MNQGRGRNRKGTLFRRFKGKRYFDLKDPAGRGGVIWLRYMVNGELVDESLKTRDEREAMKRKAAIMRPLELASTKEALLQTESRIKQVEEQEREEWKSKNPPLKLDEVWEAYTRAQNRPRSGVATLRGYGAHYRHFHEWIRSRFPRVAYMKEVGPQEAEAYAEYLLERKLSPSTYNQKLNTLSLIWGVLARKGHIQVNPFAWDRKTRTGIKRRSLKAESYRRKKRALSVEELEQVLSSTEGEYHTLIMVLACTGQRLVDAVKLEWKAIDFDRGIITLVPQKTANRSGKAVHIPLLPQLRQELVGLRKKGSYVLPDLVEQYDRDDAALSKRIKGLFESAGIKTQKETDLDTGRVVTDVGAHSLRHTFVTIARMAGLPDPVICQITGHSSQEMVDHYTQFSEEMVASLAGRLLATEGTSAKALPQQSFTQQETVPEWAQEKIRDLASRITGKRNEGIKAELLEMLGKGL